MTLDFMLSDVYRGVAQLVARTAGGREVASSSLVTPTKVRSCPQGGSLLWLWRYKT